MESMRRTVAIYCIGIGLICMLGYLIHKFGSYGCGARRSAKLNAFVSGRLDLLDQLLSYQPQLPTTAAEKTTSTSDQLPKRYRSSSVVVVMVCESIGNIIDKLLAQQASVIVTTGCGRLEALKSYQDRILVMEYNGRRDHQWQWSIDLALKVLKFDNVIFLQHPSIELAADAIEYFQAFSPVLESDSTLLCVAGYNLLSDRYSDSQIFYRQSFSNQGFMISRRKWIQLNLPDDSSISTLVGECIVPEASRTAPERQFVNSEAVKYDVAYGVVTQAFTKDIYEATLKMQVKLYSTFVSQEMLDQLVQDPVSYPQYRENKNLQDTISINDVLNPNRIFYCGQRCLRRYVIEVYGLEQPTCYKVPLKQKQRLQLTVDGRQRFLKSYAEEVVHVCKVAPERHL